MEINLRHVVVKKVEKNPAACICTGECDRGGGGCVYCSLSSSTSSCSSNGSSSPAAATPPPPPTLHSKTFMELWRVCAGPISYLPKKGNVVVYFPQGHLKQAASVSPFSVLDVPTFGLQPQIFCKVIEVELLANKENDEVYTQLTLLPITELQARQLRGTNFEEAGTEEERTPRQSTSHMFCKTLTASDTSTHGGFSVPRRAAEDCFPPLDYKEQRPSQELIANDLHGVEWKFRQIFRGQPRRHLLTTGWSLFVSQKNLMFGDAVLFLRGEEGELRLGIRRAAGPRNGLSDSIIKSQDSYPNVLAPVAKALSENGTFQIFYSPRASHADFIVPYQKYLKSITNQIHVNTRFKIRVDLDDSPERRFSGVITGAGDAEPNRWHNSRWRCLTVRWDGEEVSKQQGRVSPWEIDYSASVPALNIHTAPRIKKPRTCLQEEPHNIPKIHADQLLPGMFNKNISNVHRDLLSSPWNGYTPGQGSVWDFAESVRSVKVLQGQENFGFMSLPHGSDKINRPSDFEMHPLAYQSPVLSGVEKATHHYQPSTQTLGSRESNIFPKVFQGQENQPATETLGSRESNIFPKVFQGQEICSLGSLMRKPVLNPCAWRKPDAGFSTFSASQSINPSYYPLASEGMRNMVFPANGTYNTVQDPHMFSFTTNLKRGNHVLNATSVQSGLTMEDGRILSLAHEQRELEKTSMLPSSGIHPTDTESEKLKGKGTIFKLFGFSLTEETTTSNSQSSCKRSCTKVHKQGSLVGRAIDLSQLNNYDDLRIELDKLFGMDGHLNDPKKGWRIMYSNNENGMLIVGDDPWHEFCKVVTKIHVYTQAEVEKMCIGTFCNYTRNYMEEALPTKDVSISSSDSQPDSSQTVLRM